MNRITLHKIIHSLVSCNFNVNIYYMVVLFVVVVVILLLQHTHLSWVVRQSIKFYCVGVHFWCRTQNFYVLFNRLSILVSFVCVSQVFHQYTRGCRKKVHLNFYHKSTILHCESFFNLKPWSEQTFFGFLLRNFCLFRTIHVQISVLNISMKLHNIPFHFLSSVCVCLYLTMVSLFSFNFYTFFRLRSRLTISCPVFFFLYLSLNML